MRANLIIANPTSGQGRGAKALLETLEFLEFLGAKYKVIATDSLTESLTELKRMNLVDFQRLLVIGGDGMMHHVLNAVADINGLSEIPLGLIPAGTGNDFARALGLELKRPIKNIDRFFSQNPSSVDIGVVNGRRFGAICSTGFDSLVNERANRMSWPKGKRKYDLAMVQELPRFKPRTYLVDVDGESFETQAMLIAVGNGSSYGGGMKVCPDASIYDGLLDVMILHPVPKGEFLRIFPKVYSGTHISHPQVEIIRGKMIRVVGDAITYADGERISPTPVEITVEHGALKTWVNHG
ncbi:MAG: diacylglycerol/lipid kinase family protein [Actinomycetota bacterium]